MGRVVEAAGEGEFDPVNVSAQVHELARLLEELGEAARADTDAASKCGGGGGAGGLVEAGEGVVGTPLKIEHASTSCYGPSDIETDCGVTVA
jgi:hypothetical protein